MTSTPTRAVLVVSVVAFAHLAVGAELTHEPFNYGTALPEIQELFGKNGGKNWGGGWGEWRRGQAYRSTPASSLYLERDGYSNFANDDTQGRTTRIGNKITQRPLPYTLTGEVWVSLLAIIHDNGNGIDLGVGGNSLNFVRFQFGIEAGRGYVEFTEDGQGPSSGPLVPAGEPHLILARIQFNFNAENHEQIDLWVDPPSLTGGIAGLGTPDVTKTGFDATGGWSWFFFGTLPGNELDMFRIAHGNESSEAKLREVLRGVPVDEAPISAGTNQCGEVFGGPSAIGGVEVCFDDTTAGTLQADQIFVPTSDIDMLNELLIDPGAFDFGLPTDPAYFLDLVFDGTFSGMATLTIGYDDTTLLPFFFEEDLRVFHFVDDQWEDLGGIVDTVDNTITVTTTSFSTFALGGPLPAGRVPESAPGQPLTLTKQDGELVLSWGGSCATSDADYHVYKGALSDFTSHDQVACTTGGNTTIMLPLLDGDGYYLVVPTNDEREGSYGLDSFGVERPASVSACMPQIPTACDTP